MTGSTVFIRLEGPLQSWGDTSKFVIRRSMEAPTKSGVLGLICCAMGLSREAAREVLTDLNTLVMGVRIDRAGMRWWDFHTVGAKVGILNAKGHVKKTASTGEYETLITRREYLADASFLVALQGDDELTKIVHAALESPKWPIFLGRKCCAPSVPLLAPPSDGESWTNPQVHGSLSAALAAVSWRPRYDSESPPIPTTRDGRAELDCLMEWRALSDSDVAPDAAEVWYDVPVCFDPPVHEPRIVTRSTTVVPIARALQQHTPPPPRPRADYTSREYKKQRAARLEADGGVCVFCKSPASTVQHVSYRRAGGAETQDDLRALCRLCHDAVTMIEYGLGMGLDRIDPCQPRWRQDILRTRAEIVRFRALQVRRRRLSPDEVE